MKNITLSAEEDLIENAREVARKQKSTVNALFRKKESVKQQDREEKLRNLDLRLEYADAGGKFTREELNER